MRAGKCKIGTGAVATLKRAFVVVVCETASDNTKKQAEKLAKKLKARFFITSGTMLEQITHKENAKVLALTDRTLSNAFADNTGKEFIEIEQENEQ